MGCVAQYYQQHQGVRIIAESKTTHSEKDDGWKETVAGTKTCTHTALGKDNPCCVIMNESQGKNGAIAPCGKRDTQNTVDDVSKKVRWLH